jgi:hypothetical protein
LIGFGGSGAAGVLSLAIRFPNFLGGGPFAIFGFAQILCFLVAISGIVTLKIKGREFTPFISGSFLAMCVGDLVYLLVLASLSGR